MADEGETDSSGPEVSVAEKAATAKTALVPSQFCSHQGKLHLHRSTLGAAGKVPVGCTGGLGQVHSYGGAVGAIVLGLVCTTSHLQWLCWSGGLWK